MPLKRKLYINHVIYTKNGIYDLNGIIIMIPFFCNALSERRGPITY